MSLLSLFRDPQRRAHATERRAAPGTGTSSAEAAVPAEAVTPSSAVSPYCGG